MAKYIAKLIVEATQIEDGSWMVHGNGGDLAVSNEDFLALYEPIEADLVHRQMELLMAYIVLKAGGTIEIPSLDEVHTATQGSTVTMTPNDRGGGTIWLMRDLQEQT